MICYTLDYQGKRVIEESQLGVEVANNLSEQAMGISPDSTGSWCSDLNYTGIARTRCDTLWHPLYGERSTVRDCYNGIRVSYCKSQQAMQPTGGYDKRRAYFLDIEVRAYNEGLALRYHFPETTNGLFLHIVADETHYTLPAGTQGWYENWAQGPYTLLPLKGWGGECERPLTLRLCDGTYISLCEAGLSDFVRTKYRLDSLRQNCIASLMYGSADVIPPYSMPWRVIRVAADAPSLANGNDIMLNLNAPCAISNTAWIKPGKAFRCGLSQKEVLAGIDFCAERGMQYAELDAGWYGPESKSESDARSVAATKDLDIKALCDYGKSRGVGLILYVNQRALSRQLDSILPIYRSWGVAGLKFGFVQVGSQLWTRWLHEAVQKCAALGFVVDIHDEYRPTGWSRTWPNLLTQEGVRGNEEMPDAAHNTLLPFTRFLAGPADYTLCYFNSRIKCTRGHQLAMAVVYYSPLTFMYWYDNPSLYRGERELEFWKEVPTVWDDSRLLQGEPGHYVVTARRSGERWFVGAMNGLEARTLTVRCDFLDKGVSYKATLYQDDVLLKNHVSVEEKRVKSKNVLTFALPASGGAAVMFEPVKK